VRILPTGDRILVKPIEEATSKGGIVLPDHGREKPNRGVVVDTGPNVEGLVSGPDECTMRRCLRRNDVVIFGRYSGSEVEVDGERLLIMGSEDVLAVVTE
jgi:chaperonin GroES